MPPIAGGPIGRRLSSLTFRDLCPAPARTAALNLLLAGVSGVLTGLTFPPSSLTLVGFVALVPLLVAVGRADRTRALLYGYCTGVVFHLATCSWVLPTIARFEHISTIASLPFFVAFVAYQSLQFAVFALAVQGFDRQSPMLRAAFIASCWVGLEWIFPQVLPWHLGDRLAPSPVLRQCADVGGTYGLSFLVACVNGALAAALLGSGEPFASRLRTLAPGVALLLISAAYGAGHQQPWPTRVSSNDALRSEPERDLTIAIVQGALRSGRDDVSMANMEALRTYSQLTKPLMEPSVTTPDLVVWPETTLRVYLREDDTYRNAVLDLAHRLDRPLYVGSLDHPRTGSGEFNSAYLVDPDDAALQTYHKSVLLAFGEYVPGKTLLSPLASWHTSGAFVRDRQPGSDVVRLAIKRDGRTSHSVRFAPSICFEAIFPGAFNRGVRNGAEFLVNLTDDGWFGTTAAPYQHLESVRLRAVETRRWLVRASNSGVSVFIDPFGNIVDRLSLGATGVSQHAITTSHATTFYVRHGDWPVFLALSIVLGSHLARHRETAEDALRGAELRVRRTSTG